MYEDIIFRKGYVAQATLGLEGRYWEIGRIGNLLQTSPRSMRGIEYSRRDWLTVLQAVFT